jgi:hypothetical protein
VRVAFRKVSDERHVLEIHREDGGHEQVECETRSYLVHDFLHFAVESEAKLSTGFWGILATGRSLVDMNDRAVRAREMQKPQTAMIEFIVGALHGVAKGETAKDLVAAVRGYSVVVGVRVPAWLTEEFVVAVKERMRKLVGRWKATPYGESMDLEWPAG